MKIGTPWDARLMADYNRLVAPSSDVQLRSPVDLWAKGQLRTALDQVENAQIDRDGWIEDARYWALIVDALERPRR